MRKLVVLATAVSISLMVLGLNVSENPALVRWDDHWFLLGNVGLNTSLEQNLITVKDWNDFFDGATITVDESRLDVLSGDFVASLPADARVDLGLKLGPISVVANSYVESRFEMTLPSEMMNFVLGDVGIGEYSASGAFLDGWTIAGAGVLFGMDIGKLKLGVNTSVYVPLVSVADSSFVFDYTSSTETAQVHGDLSVDARILSVLDPSYVENGFEDLQDELPSLLDDYGGIKLDLGIAYGDRYPVWGVGVRNVVVKAAKAGFEYDVSASGEASVTMPDVGDATYTYDYSVASSTLAEPAEASIPMELTGFFTLPLGPIYLTLSGSYAMGSAYSLEATAWLPWKVLPLSVSYGYDSSGYYKKAVSIGLNLHIVAITLEGHVVSKQPIDSNPATTPLSGGVSLNFALGI